MTIDELIKDYERKIEYLRDGSAISQLVAVVYESVIDDLREIATARLLTLDEVKSLPEETDVWVELSRLFPKDSVMTATTIADHGERGCCSHYDAFKYDDYNKTPYGWRIWTRRPTREQMDGEPWDERVDPSR